VSASPKPAKGTLKRERAKRKRGRKALELEQMQAVRARDQSCRFPLCGCRHLGTILAVCHLRHRGIGGNPAGDRTQRAGMILLCQTRHHDSIIALDRGTMSCEPLTDKGTDGPVRWTVDLLRILHAARSLGQPLKLVTQSQLGWFVVATEKAPHVLEPLTDRQQDVLTFLRAMSC